MSWSCRSASDVFPLLFLGSAGSSLLHELFFSGCGEWGLLPSCDAQASRYSGFSCCRAQAQGHSGFRTVAPWLYSTGSIVGVYGLSCSVACRIFPGQGLLNLYLLNWQADSLPLSQQGSLPIAFGINCKDCIIQHLASLPTSPHAHPLHCFYHLPSNSTHKGLLFLKCDPLSLYTSTQLINRSFMRWSCYYCILCMRLLRYRQNMLRNIKLVSKGQSSNPDRSQEEIYNSKYFFGWNKSILKLT